MSINQVLRPFVGLATVAVLAAVASGAAPASAEPLSPWWQLTSNTRPSILREGGKGTIVLQALNVGDLSTSGSVTVSETLPVGLRAEKVSPKGVPEPRVSFDAYAASGGLGAEEQDRLHGEGLGPEETKASL